jgi:hypothetical protein
MTPEPEEMLPHHLQVDILRSCINPMTICKEGEGWEHAGSDNRYYTNPTVKQGCAVDASLVSHEPEIGYNRPPNPVALDYATQLQNFELRVTRNNQIHTCKVRRRLFFRIEMENTSANEELHFNAPQKII